MSKKACANKTNDALTFQFLLNTCLILRTSRKQEQIDRLKGYAHLLPSDPITDALIYELYANVNFEKTLIKLTMHLLQSCKADDANICFFVLRKHKAIDHLCGSGTVRRFFPQDLDQLASSLIENYTKRGFSHLTSQIQKHVSLLRRCKI